MEITKENLEKDVINITYKYITFHELQRIVHTSKIAQSYLTLTSLSDITGKSFAFIKLTTNKGRQITTHFRYNFLVLDSMNIIFYLKYFR